MIKKIFIIVFAFFLSCSDNSNIKISQNTLYSFFNRYNIPNCKINFTILNPETLNLDIYFYDQFKFINIDHQKVLLLKLINYLKLEKFDTIKCKTFSKDIDYDLNYTFILTKKDIYSFQSAEKLFDYCLINFNYKDFDMLNEAMIKSYNSFPYRTKNVNFFESVILFNKECEVNKGLTTGVNYLLIYLMFENEENNDLKRMTNHIKNIWMIKTGKDINESKLKFLKQIGYEKVL